MLTRRDLLVTASALLFAAPAVLVVGCHGAKAVPADPHEVSEFFDAIHDGDSAIVERLVQARPALVNSHDANGQTPLQYAQTHNMDDVVDVLKKHGAKQ